MLTHMAVPPARLPARPHRLPTVLFHLIPQRINCKSGQSRHPSATDSETGLGTFVSDSCSSKKKPRSDDRGIWNPWEYQTLSMPQPDGGDKSVSPRPRPKAAPFPLKRWREGERPSIGRTMRSDPRSHHCPAKGGEGSKCLPMHAR